MPSATQALFYSDTIVQNYCIISHVWYVSYILMLFCSAMKFYNFCCAMMVAVGVGGVQAAQRPVRQGCWGRTYDRLMSWVSREQVLICTSFVASASSGCVALIDQDPEHAQYYFYASLGFDSAIAALLYNRDRRQLSPNVVDSSVLGFLGASAACVLKGFATGKRAHLLRVLSSLIGVAGGVTVLVNDYCYRNMVRRDSESDSVIQEGISSEDERIELEYFVARANDSGNGSADAQDSDSDDDGDETGGGNDGGGV